MDVSPPAQPQPAVPPPAPDVRGVRVLVADDDAVNATLATRILAAMGCDVTVVGDGAQAVAAVREGHFDLVLLDCQMPVLDGYGAARAIRAGEAAEGRSRLPLVAVTAATRPADRERCLAVGMDEHLPKPVDEGRLRAAVARWTRAAGPALEGFGATGVVPAELAELFATNAATELDALRHALAAGDLPEVGALAHTIGGSASVLGAGRVQRVARLLEEAAGEGDRSAAGGLVQRLSDEVGAAVTAMRAAPGRG